jgi:hypothetical protein
MKICVLFLVGVAALFLATGTAHADDKKEKPPWNICFDGKKPYLVPPFIDRCADGSKPDPGVPL